MELKISSHYNKRYGFENKGTGGMRIQLVVRRSGILNNILLSHAKPARRAGALELLSLTPSLRSTRGTVRHGTIESLKMSFQYYQN